MVTSGKRCEFRGRIRDLLDYLRKCINYNNDYPKYINRLTYIHANVKNKMPGDVFKAFTSEFEQVKKQIDLEKRKYAFNYIACIANCTVEYNTVRKSILKSSRPTRQVSQDIRLQKRKRIIMSKRGITSTVYRNIEGQEVCHKA